MLLVFSCVISDTCREWLLAQFWSAQHRSVFAGNFFLAWDTETWPVWLSVGPQQGVVPGQGTRGWLGLEVSSFPAEAMASP